MRALQYVLIFVVAVFAASEPSLAAEVPARAGRLPLSPAAVGSLSPAPVMLADARSVTGRGGDLEYLPKDGAPDDSGGSSIGLLLVIAAIAVLGVIVGFIIRHHRTGRAG